MLFLTKVRLNFNKSFNCIYQLLNLTWWMQDYVVRRKNTLLIIEIVTQFEPLMAPQAVKPWTTGLAYKPTIFFSPTVGIYLATKDLPSGEFNEWADANLTLLNTKVGKHIIDTNTAILQFLTSDPCVLVQRISHKLINGFSFCFRLFIKFDLWFNLIYNTNP